MAYTADDLTRIEAAIASGTRRVRLNGREKEFHSAADLMEIRDDIVNKLARTTGTVRRPTCFRAQTGKGL